MDKQNGGGTVQEMLQEMVEEYGDRVYRLTLRYTGDRYRAEDLTQETFLRAYLHLDRFDRQRPAGPWLFKIAANLCRNWQRDEREIPVEGFEYVEDRPELRPEQACLEKESEEEIRRALKELPPIYREVLLLKHVGELSYAEIAGALEIELSLVKNRLYRGRIMLKEKLEREGRLKGEVR